jgi:ribonuclease-3
VIREIAGLPYRFSNPDLLDKALTHRSLGSYNNERLEFLGDSILSSVVSARLFSLRPDASEGDLSRLRARVVRGASLAVMAQDLGLGELLNLGEGELRSGGSRRVSILADALEAVIGAVYLDGGYAAAETAILHICGPLIDGLPDAESLKDPKTRLQEYLQAAGRPLPEYELLDIRGADHDRSFDIQCMITDTGESFAGQGSSRRKAEQAAATRALARMTGRIRHD